MPVVSNTSPLLNLAIINHLHLLEQQFSEIIIPSIVLAELKLKMNYPGTNLIQQALDAQWLRVVELKNNHLAEALMLELDQGEAAAIALALELGHKQVLMDEREGRAKAKVLGLQPTGVLGVLLRAKFDGQIPSIEAVMQSLQHEAHFFIADNLFEALLIEAGER
jgi:predicted nucleic acid-binding protein